MPGCIENGPGACVVSACTCAVRRRGVWIRVGMAPKAGGARERQCSLGNAPLSPEPLSTCAIVLCASACACCACSCARACHARYASATQELAGSTPRRDGAGRGVGRRGRAHQPRLVRGSAPLHLARLLALETEARAARAREHTITSDAREPARRTRPVELAARRLLLLLLLLILVRHGRHHGGRIRLGTAAQWQGLLLRSGLHLLGHLRDSRLGHPARRRHQAHRRHGRGGAGAWGGGDVVQHN